eukprot:365259-Chlamydomonas_euryale.AAC.12
MVGKGRCSWVGGLFTVGGAAHGGGREGGGRGEAGGWTLNLKTVGVKRTMHPPPQPHAFGVLSSAPDCHPPQTHALTGAQGWRAARPPHG